MQNITEDNYIKFKPKRLTAADQRTEQKLIADWCNKGLAEPKPIARMYADKLRARSAIADTPLEQIKTEDFYQHCDNYKKVLKHFTKHYALDLDSKELRMASMLMAALSHVRRYGTEKKISPYHAGNSARHTAHSMVLWHEMHTEAGLFEDKVFTKDVAKTYHDGMVGILLHDKGELLGESLDMAKTVGLKSELKAVGIQKAYEEKLRKLKKARAKSEEAVAKYAFKLAAIAVEKFPKNDNEAEKYFYKHLSQIRQKTGQAEYDIKWYNKVDDALADANRELVKEDKLHNLIINDKKGTFRSWCKLYDRAEEQKEFVSMALKRVERTDGARYLMRKGHRIFIPDHSKSHKEIPTEQQIHHPVVAEVFDQYPAGGEFTHDPYGMIDREGTYEKLNGAQAYSNIAISVDQMLTQQEYSESKLTKLYEMAKTPEEKALAKAIALHTYRTCIEFMIHQVPLFSSDKTKIPESDTLKNYRDLVRFHTDNPNALLTSKEILTAYFAAYHAILHDEWTPEKRKGDTIAQLKDLPELRGPLVTGDIAATLKHLQDRNVVLPEGFADTLSAQMARLESKRHYTTR